MKNILAASSLLGLVAACNGEVYVRDGVTDGDTFYLAERALYDPDPVLQSWVGYSLSKSACQLDIGGDNPARTSSFDCELSARRLLLENWRDFRRAEPAPSDGYLDALLRVADAGFLEEYVWHYFRRRHWSRPDGLRLQHFTEWRRRHLASHRPRTRLTGSWNYARNVAGD